MSTTAQVKVLISEINATTRRVYLPYMWGVLRSYCAHHYRALDGTVSWLPPLFRSMAPADAVADYADTRIDVLGLSCYTWNWERQRQVARIVKERNPHTLVVAGGPHPDYRSPRFFQDNPDIDLVVVNDGEIPFGRIIEIVAGGGTDFSAVPGVVLRDEDGHPTMTLPPEKPTTFLHSPYLEHVELYESIIREDEGRVNLVWETNRGCPYKCSYCDWGSNTMGKLRIFDIGRVEAEAEWIFRHPFATILLTDANFGILPRDVEIARLLERLRSRFEGPKVFYYSAAKNNPDRSSEIARTFARAGIATTHYVAVQHTDPEVLAATDRANISIEKQRQVVREMLDEGVPLAAQVILGIPGDTVGKWEQVFADLMEWGIHDDYVVSEYVVLPNAPAADPAFREEWGYRTIRRFARDLGLRRDKGAGREGCFQVEIIVESKTFTPEDWVRMRVYSDFIIALHNSGYTRRIAQYLRYTHEISYREFYDAVINEFCRQRLFGGEWWRALEQSLDRFLRDEDAFDDLSLEEIPELDEYMRYADWLMVKVGLCRAPFYEQLGDFLAERFPRIPLLRSVIDYQRELIITAEYDSDEGKRFSSDRNWPAYFREIDEGMAQPPIVEPEELAAGLDFEIRDTTTGEFSQAALDWHLHPDPQERLRRWAQNIPLGRRSEGWQCFDEPALATRRPMMVQLT